MRHTLRLMLPLAGLLPAAGVFAGDLTVNVERVRSDRGSVLAALYDSAATFMQQPTARATFKVKATKGTVQYVFHDLPAGQYALSVFHDENGNGRLDRNLLGIPREGYGFSNDAEAHLGPPAFGKAGFDFDGKVKSITITLHY